MLRTAIYADLILLWLSFGAFLYCADMPQRVFRQVAPRQEYAGGLVIGNGGLVYCHKDWYLSPYKEDVAQQAWEVVYRVRTTAEGRERRDQTIRIFWDSYQEPGEIIYEYATYSPSVGLEMLRQPEPFEVTDKKTLSPRKRLASMSALIKPAPIYYNYQAQ